MPRTLSEAARAEIAEAIRIVKEDREKTPPVPPAPKDGDPPPVKDKADEEAPVLRPGLWWGKRLHETSE